MSYSIEETVALQKRLGHTMQSNSHKTFTLQLNAGGVALLHSLVCIAERSPEVQDLGESAKKLISYILDSCKDAWGEMGLSEQDIIELDALQREG